MAAAVPYPWLEAPLRAALVAQRGHALLVHGAPGVGQFELALGLALAWLCEAGDGRSPACGQCAACRLTQAHSHPDLLVLLPEALREPLGWATEGDESEAADGDKGKRKPSKEVRVDEVRRAIAFAQTTSARGRGKVVVLYPAERMNLVAANALLKTLEEPPGAARLVLASAAPQALLPTIRSRCQSVVLSAPDPAIAAGWLEGQGVAQAAALLSLAAGQPLQVLAWAAEGIPAAGLLGLPAQLARGDATGLAQWPVPSFIELLQKLTHDAARLAAGAAPRFFPAAAFQGLRPTPTAVQRFADRLDEVARHADHPWNAALLAESLAQQAGAMLGAAAPRARGAPLHSA